MPTVTIQITAAGNTVGRTKTISAAHLLRFLAAYKSLLGKVVDVEGTPASPGNPAVPTTYRDMTDDECVLAWVDSYLKGTQNNVLSQEKAIAAQAANTAQTSIAFT